MKKPSIPSLQAIDPTARSILAPMKEILEQHTGARGGRIAPLSSSASTADIINKINELLDKLQAG